MKVRFAVAVAVASALFAVTAQAQTTVTLGTAGCASSRVCANVPNDGELQIDWLSASSQYGRVTMHIDGVMWDSGLYGASPLGKDFSRVTLYDGMGHTLQVSATFTTWVTKVNSGRAHYYLTHWRLDSGTLSM